MKNSLLKIFSRTMLVLACCLVANSAWADDFYMVAGNNAAIFGSAWDNTNEDTRMTLVDGIYQWTSPEFVVSNNYGVRYKVLKNGDWSTSWGGDYDGNDHNQGYDINSSGRYTMTFFFNPNDNYAVYAELHDIFTVAGSSTELFGAQWDLNASANNDMTYSGNGIWTWTKNGVELTAGNIEFKAVKGRDFAYGKWPDGDNYVLNIPSDGVYNVTITLNLNNNSISVNLDKLLAHDATNFPDENFRSYLSSIHQNPAVSGYWSPAELAAVTEMDCSGQNIKSLKGIEHFTALTTLNCSNNKLASLDLTNTAVTSLNASNQTVALEGLVQELKMSDNKYIYFIWLYDNGEDPWFVGAMNEYQGTQTFDMSRVTWGEGCEVVHGTKTTTNMLALSDGVDPAEIPGDILLVDTSNGQSGSFTYTYSTSANRDGNTMEVTSNWSGTSTPTAIDTVNGKSELKATRYYNLMGVESATPFDGVNIVVKEYTDGSRTTSKMVR